MSSPKMAFQLVSILDTSASIVAWSNSSKLAISVNASFNTYSIPFASIKHSYKSCLEILAFPTVARTEEPSVTFDVYVVLLAHPANITTRKAKVNNFFIYAALPSVVAK